MPSLSPHGVTHIWVTHTQHTHTHTCRWRRWKIFSAFIPSWRPPPGTARSSGRPAMPAPGDQVQVLSPDLVRVRTRTDEHSALFACFYCWGSYGGNPGNTGRTCKLHRERPGNKPRHVARCGTWTHDLLAVRQTVLRTKFSCHLVSTLGLHKKVGFSQWNMSQNQYHRLSGLEHSETDKKINRELSSGVVTFVCGGHLRMGRS